MSYWSEDIRHWVPGKLTASMPRTGFMACPTSPEVPSRDWFDCCWGGGACWTGVAADGWAGIPLMELDGPGTCPMPPRPFCGPPENTEEMRWRVVEMLDPGKLRNYVQLAGSCHGNDFWPENSIWTKFPKLLSKHSGSRHENRRFLTFPKVVYLKWIKNLFFRFYHFLSVGVS